MIVYYFDGGLCNRLRPLLSLYSESNEPLNIIWPDSQGCACEANKILKNVNIVNNMNLDEFDEIYSENPRHHIESLVTKTKPANTFWRKDILKHKVVYSNKEVNVSNSEKKCLVLKYPFFLKKTDFKKIPEAFSNVILEKILYNALDLKKSLNLNDDVIGCHLRATDLSNSIKLKNIINLIKIKHSTRFFICSDNQNVEHQFDEIDNVITYHKNSYVKMNSGNTGWHKNCLRDEVQVYEAIIDICLLSFCNISDNSYHTVPESTFIDTARNVKGWENFI